MNRMIIPTSNDFGEGSLKVGVPYEIGLKVAQALDDSGLHIVPADFSRDFVPDIFFEGGHVTHSRNEDGSEVKYLKPGGDVILGRTEVPIGDVSVEDVVKRITRRVKNHALSKADPTKSDHGIFSDVEKISFLQDGKPIDPLNIFEGYNLLEPLISMNKQHDPYRNTGMSQDVVNGNREDMLSVWKAQAEKDLVAIVRNANESVVAFNVEYRTNFTSQLTKKPNIVFLRHGGFRLPLRHAVVYEEDVVGPQVGQYGNKIDRKYFEAMIKGEHAGMRPDPRKVFLFPEPYLVAALELLYGEKLGSNTNDNCPRVTPNIKVVGTSDKDVLYLRSWLKPFTDLPFDPQSVAMYLGAMQAYGIFEEHWERQMVHYCEHPDNGGTITVNLDPDLMMHRGGKHNYTGNDTRDFCTKLAMANKSLTKEEITEFRKQANLVRDYYSGFGLDQRLVEAIPPSIAESILPDMRISAYNPRR